MLSVALTPDNQWVLSGSKDRGVQFWDPRTGDTQLMLQGHKNSGMSIRCYTTSSSVSHCNISNEVPGMNSDIGSPESHRRLVRHWKRRHAGKNMEVREDLDIRLVLPMLTCIALTRYGPWHGN